MINEKLIRVHKIVAFAYFFFVGIGILIAITSLIRGRDDSFGFGVFCCLAFGPIGLFHFYAAKGARAGAPWGRNMSRVIGVLLLFGFPIGTALGVYILAQTGAKWQNKGAVLN